MEERLGAIVYEILSIFILDHEVTLSLGRTNSQPRHNKNVRGAALLLLRPCPLLLAPDGRTDLALGSRDSLMSRGTS